MHPAKVTHHRAANHDVVEVGNDEVGVGDMHVNPQRGQEQSGKTSHGKQADETKGVQHGSGKRNRAFVHGRGPVEDLDG